MKGIDIIKTFNKNERITSINTSTVIIINTQYLFFLILNNHQSIDYVNHIIYSNFFIHQLTNLNTFAF